MTEKLTGGPVDYYKVDIKHPTSLSGTYTAECNDVIEALNMTFAEGEAFKAIWRLAASRTLGKLKPGMTHLYDAEKVEFFGHRMAEQHRVKPASANTLHSVTPLVADTHGIPSFLTTEKR